MNRFLNRRDKDNCTSDRRDRIREKKIRPLSSDSLWYFFKNSSHKKQDQEHTNIVVEIKKKLVDAGYPALKDEEVNYALASDYADGDPERAYEMLVLFQESAEGLIHPCDPNITLVGAINRNNVTCYIDSVLFAMLGGLQSYDLIFCGEFEKDTQRILSRILLLYANMLRTGKLIHADLTKNLQEALVACGWEHNQTEQQDASEFYGFIAQTLNIPLLSMKSNIFHHATPDENHDHRIVEEQVLNVSIPDTDDGQTIPLERCLEGFLNNTVEITRTLPRTDLFQSTRLDHENEMLCRSESTPCVPLSRSQAESSMLNNLARSRTVEETNVRRGSASDEKNSTLQPAYQEGSTRKDVRILAWQFFNILPWHGKNSATGKSVDIEKTAPALAICLKRYGFKDGQPYRKSTPIDIPKVMLLPHLVDDDGLDNPDQLQNFKLVLMAVVCHRGQSLNEGHYTTLVRRAAPVADGDLNSARKLSDASRPPHYSEDQWYKFDDLVEPRVVQVNFEEAIISEMPYLLFYQVQPQFQSNFSSYEYANSDQEPPSYDSGVALTASTSYPSDGIKTGNASCVECTSPIDQETKCTENIHIRTNSLNPLNLATEERASNLAPPTLNLSTSSFTISLGDESTKARLSRAASKFAKNSCRSRPTSQSGESRISATISRLNLMRSKEQLTRSEAFKERYSLEEALGSSHPLTIPETAPNPGEDSSDNSKKKKKKRRSKSRGHIDRKERGSNPTCSLEEKGKLKEADRECKIM
ncbi:BgTH12-01954 [Blumeria graminis f. sp. triticale]|uniref:ubiquitinyl hydrolase 1 n=1 Tax=Blumeria graminis f. sp. triticale TaxID=1689686 RepID=A0A9W4DH78_BLUGR|nr:BgTH12-01954 [Blumeria graminis f. sp. triticale]